jgi:hypothetical protein
MSQPTGIPSTKSSASQSPSFLPVKGSCIAFKMAMVVALTVVGAVAVQVSMPPLTFNDVNDQPIKFFEEQVIPAKRGFVMKVLMSATSKANVVTVPVPPSEAATTMQSTASNPAEPVVPVLDPHVGLPPGPPPMFTRGSPMPSARTTLEAKIRTAAAKISLKALKCAPPCNFPRSVGSIYSTKLLNTPWTRKPFVCNTARLCLRWPQIIMCNVFDQLGNMRYFGVIPCSSYHESPSVPFLPGRHYSR